MVVSTSKKPAYKIVDIAQIVEGHVAVRLLHRAGDPRACRLPPRQHCARLRRFAGAQCHQRGERRAQRRGRLAKKFRNASLRQALAAGDVGAQQLAKLGDDDGCCRVGFRCRIENDVGALQVSGKHQKLGEQ